MNRREALKRTALMMGAAVSASTIAAVLDGCSPAATGMEWTPQFLDALQADIVSGITERIIPRTDTVGAQDVGVPAFVDLMYGKYMTPKEQEVLVKGLAQAEADSQAAHQKAFTSLSGEQQDELLKKMATSEGEPQAFFRKMRELTLTGFFTSEVVAKEILHYDPIPGDYKGCVPIEEVGNVNWAKM